MSKRKLLLADDSVTIQKVVNLTFADEGIEVIAARDGNAALEKFAEASPDLVLADVNMPGLSGYQICEKIKQNERTKNVPVILLVGSFEPFDEQEARRVGADDFLTKPFQSIRQLVNKVSDLINSGAAAENGNGEPVSSLAEEAPAQTGETHSENFDTFSTAQTDAAVDDEIIQTEQIGSLPVNDVQKFEANFVSEPLEEDFSGNGTDSGADFGNLENRESNETFPANTEFSSEEEFDETTFEETEETSSNENAFAFAEAKDSASEEFGRKAKTFSRFELDETNLLEIPPMENPYLTNLSPEFVEAVANRVVEKLSDRAVRDVAREVVPQMADLIIRQMAEEKFKE